MIFSCYWGTLMHKTREAVTRAGALTVKMLRTRLLGLLQLAVLLVTRTVCTGTSARAADVNAGVQLTGVQLSGGAELSVGVQMTGGAEQMVGAEVPSTMASTPMLVGEAEEKGGRAGEAARAGAEHRDHVSGQR